MKIYCAAPWIHREAASTAASKLEAAGHTITHKWWVHEGGNDGYYDDAADREVRLKGNAQDDFNGAASADVLVLLSSAKSEGKATEQGVALAKGIPIVAVGTRGEFSNIFHYLDAYKWVGSIEEAIEELNHMKERRTNELECSCSNCSGRR
jgi:nucleoside 2-deoxyribosyltransferase